MAFDEKGQADTIARKVEICQRAYHLLTTQAGFDPTDIIFGPQRPGGATGSKNNDYAINFIEATRIIKDTCPGVKVSGGISNLSFSFRGNDVVREAIHSAFLYHAPSRPASTWASSTPVSLSSVRTFPRNCSSASKTSSSIVARCDRARRVRGHREGRRQSREQDLAAPAAPSNRASRMRWCMVSSTSSIGTSRKRVRAAASARCDRRAADGRYEGCRRSCSAPARCSSRRW